MEGEPMEGEPMEGEPMEGEPRFVGIDVSKAQVDVAVRPTGKSWVVTYDETGIKELVSQMVDLGPAMVLLEATGWSGTAVGGRSRCCGAAGGGGQPAPGSRLRQGYRYPGQDRLSRCGGPGSLRRRRSSLGAPPQRRGDPGPQLADCPQAPGVDHAGLGKEPAGYCHQRGASPHRIPHRLVGTGVERLGQGVKAVSSPKSSMAREGRTAARRSPAWGSSSLSPCWPTCPSWARWTDGRSRPWWAWRPSTGTAVPCEADAPSGADAPGFEAFSTWGR